MAQDRRTKEAPTPGQDPREIDRERTTDQAVRETAAQEALVHPQRPKGAQGSSADAPGRDLGDLEDAPEVDEYRYTS